MLSLQIISDRLELEDLVHAYARAIDARDFGALVSDIFAPGAKVDYSSVGGAVGHVEDLLAWIKPGLGALGPSQHLMANHQFEIDGDKARGRIMCYNPILTPRGDEGSQAVIVHGLFYEDLYARTREGWRITSRRADGTYRFGTSPDPYVEG